MKKTTLRVAGYVSAGFGLFWILITTLGFVYLMAEGESPAIQSKTAIELCNMFLEVWYNPALKIYDFASAPKNTETLFWCVLTLIIMLIFIIYGIKLVKYSKKDYDIKDCTSKIVLFIMLSFVILCFAIFGCVDAVEITPIMFLNMFALIIMFLLPTIECIKTSKE